MCISASLLDSVMKFLSYRMYIVYTGAGILVVLILICVWRALERKCKKKWDFVIEYNTQYHNSFYV